MFLALEFWKATHTSTEHNYNVDQRHRQVYRELIGIQCQINSVLVKLVQGHTVI